MFTENVLFAGFIFGLLAFVVGRELFLTGCSPDLFQVALSKVGIEYELAEL